MLSAVDNNVYTADVLYAFHASSSRPLRDSG